MHEQSERAEVLSRDLQLRGGGSGVVPRVVLDARRPRFQLVVRYLIRFDVGKLLLMALGAHHGLEDSARAASALEPLEGEHPGLLR